MKLAVKLFTIATAYTLLNPLWAATYTYEAITDFTDINAGVVPYYRHNGVNALAINAAVEIYRDKFARATVEFEQESGVYDVTITSLGEIDGDGEFRFLVDGVVMASAINEPAVEDYGEQLHTFENISIPEGAEISVESSAVSNGTVPEGDAYAYARGRWTTLTITDVETDTATPDPVELVDLSINLSVSSATAVIDDDVTYTVEIENLSDYIATNPVVVVNLPQGINNAVSDSCIDTDTATLTCTLAELPGNDVTSFSINATVTTDGEQEVTAEVVADQDESDSTNNNDSATTIVETAVVETPVTEPPATSTDNSVDLELKITTSTDRLEINQSVTYFFSVTNLHTSNTATTPIVGVQLPDSLQFVSSDLCTAGDALITCDLEELPPGADADAQLTAKAIEINSYSEVFATASSAQPEISEDAVANNEVQVVTAISPETLRNVVTIAEQQASATNTTVKQNKSNGGGSFQSLALLLLLLRLYPARHRYALK